MTHQASAATFIADRDRMQWHDQALWYVRQKRDLASQRVEEWEALRESASRIKRHTLANLDTYLERFEKNATQNGITVHWARDAKEHNAIVHQILEKNSATKVVKSKSMLTEECGLNPYLEKRGIEVVDTDLGERIIQLKGDAPSHIVLPAIHLRKEEVGEIFEAHLGSQKGVSDPDYLTAVAREHLRQKFLEADAAITGVNFALSESGSVVVCTNEGNADMGVSLAKVHIASMGIEKVIPSQKELGVFVRLLARSATGQAITTYTSHFSKPRDGAQMHVIIVDNGRSDILGREDFHNALRCIRCGACLNTCPIYRRSGGHSYRFVIPGPIGSTLGALKAPKQYSDLPFACTLCGSCSNVCPVKIDLDYQLYLHRQMPTQNSAMQKKRKIMRGVAFVMRHPKLFDAVGKTVRKIAPKLPRSLLYHSKNIWGRTRELPDFPKESFKELYQKERHGKR